MTEVIYTFLQLSLRMRLGSHNGVAKRVLARKESKVPVTIKLHIKGKGHPATGRGGPRGSG